MKNFTKKRLDSIKRLNKMELEEIVHSLAFDRDQKVAARRELNRRKKMVEA